MTDESIHPRVRHTDGVKKHTNAAPNKGVLARKIATIEGHLERHPRDSAPQSHLSKLKARL
jgi:ribosomal protein S15P/S13E